MRWRLCVERNAILPLIVAFTWGISLPKLIAGALAARLLSVLLHARACRRAVPVRRPTPALPGELRGLFIFGGWLTVSNVISPILTAWDRFLIGAMLSAAAVAIYVVPFNLVSQVSLLPFALTSALYPLLASGESGERQRLAGKAVAALSVSLTPLVLLGLLLAEPFLCLWLGDARGAAAAPVAALLFFGVWANSFALIPAAHLEAQAQPSAFAKLHLAEVLPYLALLYLAVRGFGIAGAAFAWSVRCTVDALLLFRIAREPLPPSVLPQAVLIASGILVALMIPVGAPLRWALAAGLLVLGGALVVGRNRAIAAELLGRVRRRDAA